MFLGIIFDKIIANRILLVLVLIVFAGYFYDQIIPTSGYLSSGVDGENTISLGNESAAVRYVLLDSRNVPFNIDVYSPPVITYPYTYLFRYYGDKYNIYPNNNLVSNLYTIHEVDMEIPKREKNWLIRQDGIGTILTKTSLGGIRIELRQRINWNK